MGEGAPPRRPLPKRARESIVIEAQIPRPASGALLAGFPRGWPWVAGGAALAFGGLALFWARPDPAPVERRLSALESASAAAGDRDAALAARLAKAEAALSPGPAAVKAAAALELRVASLEATALPAGALAAIAADARSARAAAADALAAAAAPQPGLADLAQRLDDDAKARADLQTRLDRVEATLAEPKPDPDALAHRLDAEGAERAGLQSRVERVEAALARPKPELDALAGRLAAAEAERATLSSRLDRIEATLAEPKAQTPAGPDRPSAALAVAALAVRQRLRDGAPLDADLKTLDRLGVEPAELAPLRAFADKAAPTSAELMASFVKLAPEMQAAPSPPAANAVGRVLSEVQGLVKRREVGDKRASDGAAEVEAALARGDLAGALAAARALPHPEAAAGWMQALQARREADEAAERLVEAALGGLGR